MDHLIYTLVMVMLPSYENRHNRQKLGFDGPDLANKRRTEILVRAPELKVESICNLGDDQFSVQSVTHSPRTYSVELRAQSCNCPDWPRVQLCKHVAAVAHYFGGNQQIDAKIETLKTVKPNWDREGSLGAQSDGSSAASIVENVIAVSRAYLDDGAPSSPATVRSLQMVESHLSAIVRTSQPESPLPDKVVLPPNQGTNWAETAQRMGATRKRRRPHPTTTSSPDPPPATELIGELNRKKLRVKLTDPYSGGVSSGKRAEPDARSAAKNAEVRTHQAAVASGASIPIPSQTKRGRKRVVVPQALPPTAPPFTPPSSAPLPPSLPPFPTPDFPPIPWYTIHAFPHGLPAPAPPATAAMDSTLHAHTSTSTAPPPPAYPAHPGYYGYWPYSSSQPF